ncbi:hypothetical protein D3C72_1578050 [compost metagenome]
MEQILDNLIWIEELLPHDVLSIPKHGGMAYYLDEKLVLILVEQSNSTYEHKGVTYPFQLWNGCIFPVEYRKQSAFFLKYLFLENHPANKDWLYIPAETDSFEEEVKQVMREITKRNPLLGTAVKVKALSDEKPAKKTEKKKAPQPAKASKKRENSFLLAIANKQKK